MYESALNNFTIFRSLLLIDDELENNFKAVSFLTKIYRF